MLEAMSMVAFRNLPSLPSIIMPFLNLLFVFIVVFIVVLCNEASSLNHGRNAVL